VEKEIEKKEKKELKESSERKDRIIDRNSYRKTTNLTKNSNN